MKAEEKFAQGRLALGSGNKPSQLGMSASMPGKLRSTNPSKTSSLHGQKHRSTMVGGSRLVPDNQEDNRGGFDPLAAAAGGGSSRRMTSRAPDGGGGHHHHHHHQN